MVFTQAFGHRVVSVRFSYHDMQEAGLEIVPLEEKSLVDVLELERQGYANPWSESVFLGCFRNDYRLWGIKVAGSLAGYCIAACLVDEVHLLNLCIGARHRKAGLGRRLLRHLATHAAREGMNRLLLEVRQSNHGAIALYESEGLTRIGVRPGYYPDGPGREDALVMELLLSATPET